MKLARNILLGVLLLGLLSASAQAQTVNSVLSDEDRCVVTEVAEFAAAKNCNFLNDPDQNIELAMRTCNRYGRLCNPAWTDEQLGECRDLAAGRCAALNDGERQLIITNADGQQKPARETVATTDVEAIDQPVADVTTGSSDETAEETTDATEDMANDMTEDTDMSDESMTEEMDDSTMEEENMQSSSNTGLIILVVLVVAVIGWFVFGKKKESKGNSKKSAKKKE